MPNEVMRFLIAVGSEPPFEIRIGDNAPPAVRKAAERLIEAARRHPEVIVTRAALTRQDVLTADDIVTWLTASQRLRSPVQIREQPARIVTALMTYPGLVPLACAKFLHHYGVCTCPELGTDHSTDGREYSEWQYYNVRKLPRRSGLGWTIVRRELAQVDVSRIPFGYNGRMSPSTRDHLLALIAHVRAGLD